MTRPDLAFSVQVLSQFMHCPKESHIEAALRVVRYIKEAPGLGLLMPAKDTNKLLAYYDSDWGSCLEIRRSVTGYLVKFGGALISWKSKKRETVTRSSAEAEFRSMAHCAAEVT
ncbi:secreted RxLR effector protein 161-like [Solanum dulcamara]|uniref:secreted RxLR effector protein 161-like n=1 Tax=Solanum dulcamara TaxID=45834 RepID=UPI002486341F|nr:secreted RxLR effector protein 161-like [Solanum dulcamara]